MGYRFGKGNFKNFSKGLEQVADAFDSCGYLISLVHNIHGGIYDIKLN